MPADVSILDVVDILVVAYVVYRLLTLIRGTRAIPLLKGIGLLFAAVAVSRFLNLRAVGWLLDRAITALLVAFPVVFYPELRRALEQLGRAEFFGRRRLADRQVPAAFHEELVRTVGRLARTRTGALIVLERETGLEEFTETGVAVDARFSPELLINIFTPGTPLHDGAVILRGDRIVAAACLLPLAEHHDMEYGLGTRHRAALGMAEQSDALVIVVSEETGIISVAVDGRLHRPLSEEALRGFLERATTGGRGRAATPTSLGRLFR